MARCCCRPCSTCRLTSCELYTPIPFSWLSLRRVVVDGNPIRVREVDPVQGVVVCTGVPVTLLWSAFRQQDSRSPRCCIPCCFTSSFQFDPLTSIPFHALLQTLFWVTLFPSLPSVSRIPSWSFHRAVLLNTVLLDEPLRDVMPFSVLWFATLLTRDTVPVRVREVNS